MNNFVAYIDEFRGSYNSSGQQSTTRSVPVLPVRQNSTWNSTTMAQSSGALPVVRSTWSRTQTQLTSAASAMATAPSAVASRPRIAFSQSSSSSKLRDTNSQFTIRFQPDPYYHTLEELIKPKILCKMIIL